VLAARAECGGIYTIIDKRRSSMKIGMIGIGIMGFAMSQKLMQAGHQVYG
jgi:UDP-N-acetyl-D-mannosaminuronate dehydrogenase